jgi:hypothetical protein
MFRLRKTRPPFSLQREESFSSGEEDIFNDEGFREMTAENLFSTLLTRVKSLTRRIHDEHEDNPALRWQQSRRIINHPLNPGGTHARLERSALRSSIKRSGPPSSAASSTTTAPSLSRQSSYGVPDERSSNFDDSSSRYRGTRSETDSLLSEPVPGETGGSRVGSGKGLDNFDDSQISVTSRQRLRPGYLPPPQFVPSPLSPPPYDPSATTTYSSSTVSSRTFDTPASVTVGSDVGSGVERTIHIAVQMPPPRQELPVSASSSASSISSKPVGVYHRPAKPFSPSEVQFCDPVEAKEKRVSRFLRPDFYDTPKEESIYGRDDGGDGDDDGSRKTTSRFLRAVRERKHSMEADLRSPPAQQDDPPPSAEGQSLVRALTHKKHQPNPQGPASTSATSSSSATSPSVTTFTSSSATTACTSPPPALRPAPPPPLVSAPALKLAPPPPLVSAPALKLAPPPPLVTAPAMAPAPAPIVSPITVTPVTTKPVRPPPPSKAPSPPPVSPPPYRVPRSPPPPAPKSAAAPAAAARSLPWVKSAPNRPYLPPTSPPPGRADSSRARRQILPYGGAKSDGLINQHAFVACHVIAAAERKKRESYSRSSTAELPLEKVTGPEIQQTKRPTSIK